MRRGLAVAALALCAVAGLVPATAAAGAAPAEHDWTTFGFNDQRQGYNPFETTLTPAAVKGLTQQWTFDLGGAALAQPVIATGVDVNGTPTDIVYVASDNANGTIYALDAAGGAVVWQVDLGAQTTGCEDLPGGVFGTSDTPAIDRADGRLFVVGGDGRLYALDLADGAIEPGFPQVVTSDPAHEHVYSGVTLFDGSVYVATASYCDNTPYQGRVDRFDALSGALENTFYVDGAGGSGDSGGGIWGPGGVSVDPANGNVYAATGNAMAGDEHEAYAEHVIRMGPALAVKASHYPGLTGGDVDFGATPLLYTVPGCPPQLLAKNKSGVLLLYDRNAIAKGYRQRLQVASVTDWQFNGIPAYSPVTKLVYVSNSTDSAGFHHGLVAFKTGPKDCKLHLAWQQAVGPNSTSVSPPTVADGVVYYADGSGDTLRAFNAATGAKLWNSGGTIAGPAYAAPTVINGRVYITAWDDELHVYGP